MMATIKIEIKPIRSKEEEAYLHAEINRFVDQLNLRFGLIVTEVFKPVCNNVKDL